MPPKTEQKQIIRATVSRTIEFQKQWYKFEYSEERTVVNNAAKEKEDLWKDCIFEVDKQIDDLKNFLGV